jgi:DNA-binding MarR family transcriptional regulator
VAKPLRKTRQGEPAQPAPALKGVTGGRAMLGADLDKVIHERVRLAIISALAVNPALGFTELRDLLDTTDGNLSVHARKLEDAGYLQCLKSFEGRTPRTEFKITAAGRRALEQYLEHMEALIRMTRR